MDMPLSSSIQNTVWLHRYTRRDKEEDKNENKNNNNNNTSNNNNNNEIGRGIKKE